MRNTRILLTTLFAAFFFVSCAGEKANETDDQKQQEPQGPVETVDNFGTDYTDTADDIFVDMGTEARWATKNVGAARSTDAGDYDFYEDGPVTVINGENSYIGYVPDTHESGKSWEALIDACSKKKDGDVGYIKWTEVNSVKGIAARSSVTGNIIFFPAAGYKTGGKLEGFGQHFSYWTSHLAPGASGEGQVVHVFAAECDANADIDFVVRKMDEYAMPTRLILY